jgi:RNA-directed DNA polymerase
VGVCRQRCWEYDWVIDLDIEAFFDTLDHELVLKAVQKHTEVRWIILYIERWLGAPLQEADGTLVERTTGSPQGSAISPLLANLYLHYAFDVWMTHRHPGCPFERYCDDIVVHCRSKAEAEGVLAAISERLAACKLTVNREKTRIVYCKDDRRKGDHEPQQFDFLGYTFRPRRCKNHRDGTYFVGFNPAVSNAAKKRMGEIIRAWRLQRRSGATISELAEAINRVVRGWINYYGRYFPSELTPILKRINERLVRWAQRKYKRLRPSPKRAWQFLAGIAQREPALFAHWTLGLQPRAEGRGAG